MFGSLILPTTTITGGGAAALTGTRITSRSCGGGGIQSISPNLSSMGSIPNTTNYYYHPTMSFPFPFPSPKLIPPPRTGRRIRASFTTAPAPSDTNTNTNTNLNLYQILRIKQNASSLEIKTAYRKLAKQFHPDALPPPPPTTSSSSDDHDAGGASDFMAIHNAYATLSDPTERARYDFSIQIHNTRRFHSYYSTSTTTTTVDGNEDRRSYGRMQTTKRWETDQCW